MEPTLSSTFERERCSSRNFFFPFPAYKSLRKFIRIMKRKQPVSSPSETDSGKPVAKKSKAAVIQTPSALPSPRRRAFERQCKFMKGEKIIGFYGGWPYVGSVNAIVTVNMSFGATYLVQVRWNGFSGKRAVSWISEFDIVKHNEAGLKLKSDVCNLPPISRTQCVDGAGSARSNQGRWRQSRQGEVSEDILASSI